MRCVAMRKYCSISFPLTTNLPVPGRRRTRATASLRRPVVWIRGLLNGVFLSRRLRGGLRRQRVVDRPLGEVRMGGTRVDAQLLQHRAAEPVLREHAPDRELHDPLRGASHEALQGLGADAARVAGVAVVELVLALAER